MAVPYTFQTATGSIPLSQLDSNFATGITIGNTSVLLGDTITFINNLSLANVTISSVASAFPNNYLANSNVIVGTTTLTLGTTVSTISGLTLSNVTISSGNVTISNVTTTNVTATTANVTTTNTSSLVVTGNQTFVGTGNRITGDFSNATVANRVEFQSSSTNGNTAIGAIPNGTATTAAFDVFNNSDTTNAGRGRFIISAASVDIQSTITGTGTYLPMTFYTGGSERMRIDTSGNLGIGTSSPSTIGVSGYTRLVLGAGGNATEGLTIVPSGTGGVQFTDAAATEKGYIKWVSSTGALNFGTAGTTRLTVDSSGNVQVQAGAVMPYAPAPASISTTATLTNANIQAQIINTTGTTYTVTMPLGTTLETLATWATTNVAYDFFVINTATGIITMAVNTGVTSLGLLTIAAATSAHFRIRRTAANTFVLYRLV